MLTGCEENNPPETPSPPIGPSTGFQNESLSFSAVTTDPDGDNISYQFDWGDGNLSTWSDYIPGGDTITINHTYADTGIYEIRVHAKDDYRISFLDVIAGAVSGWSAEHIITISASTSTYPNHEIATVSVGTSPLYDGALPNGEYVYVTNYYSDNVSVIRTSDNTVVNTITVKTGPAHIASLPNGEYIYVANHLSGNVSVIRTSDNTVVDNIQVGNAPHGVTSMPDGKYVYVTNEYDNNVSVIGY